MALSVASYPAREKFPQIISHRGASGYLPEHSLAAYQLAIDLGTDYIEPDLCLSKDGVFVVMHDLLLDDTTDVDSIEAYRSRKRTQEVDGKNLTGYFVSDFLFSELKTLKLHQRLSYRSALFDNYLSIPSLSEVYALIQSNYDNTAHTTGIYAELKHPEYFRGLGFLMDDMLLKSLKEEGGYAVYPEDNAPSDLRTSVVPVVIQCFNPVTLQLLAPKTSIPLVQLLEDNESHFWNKEVVSSLASYVQGVGPSKSYFEEEPLKEVKRSVDLIHSFGLVIHPYTFRADSDIGSKFSSFEEEEIYFYCCLGECCHVLRRFSACDV